MSYRIVISIKQRASKSIAITRNSPKIAIDPYNPTDILQYLFEQCAIDKDTNIENIFISDNENDEPLAIFALSKTTIDIIYTNDDTKRGLRFPIYKDVKIKGGCKSIW